MCGCDVLSIKPSQWASAQSSGAHVMCISSGCAILLTGVGLELVITGGATVVELDGVHGGQGWATVMEDCTETEERQLRFRV